MSWLQKKAESDKVRIENNIQRLDDLKRRVHDLGYFAIASQSGGYQALLDLLDNKLVKGREYVYNKLKSALVGENNSKLVLDAPSRFQAILIEAETLIDREISKEKRRLRELLSKHDNKEE